MDASIDNLWLLFACVLVLFMQAGFLLIEGGRVRAKNSINVAQKNLTDLVVSWLSYFALGFLIMYGVSLPSPDPLVDASVVAPGPLPFLFQLVICGTAVTILSGCVAERMSFKFYVCLVAVVSSVIYPIVGRLSWGDAFASVNFTYLADMGFIDFAGSSIVHSVGAWVGLVAIMVMGPRLGRFDSHGNVLPMASSNSVIMLLGVIILLIGWLGFNGGALSITSPALPYVLLGTLVSACVGGFVGMVVAYHLDGKLFNPAGISNGMIGGLVCCTAGIHVMDLHEAMVAGVVGGLVATIGAWWLLYKAKLDDPVDAIACHGFAGVAGTLLVAGVAPVELLVDQSRIAQFGVQLFGVICIFVFVGVTTWLSLKIIGYFYDMRVLAESEEIGLNFSEHGVAVGTGKLEKALKEQLGNTGPGIQTIDLEQSDENSELANAFNHLIVKNEQHRQLANESEHRFKQFAEIASDWLWETDKHLKISYVNTSKPDIETVLCQGSLGQPLLEIINMDAEAKRYVENCFKNRESTNVFDARIPFLHHANVELFVEIRAVPNINEDGVFQGYRGVATDITVRKAAENRAEFLAEHDELTSLCNRRGLSHTLPTVFAEAQSENLAVVVVGIDLDGFKAVNDSYGHLTGDSLLCKVAQRIENDLRPGDQVFRTGGDEFVLIMPGFSQQGAMEGGVRVAERMIEVISKGYIIDTIAIDIGASMGVAVYPNHADSAEEIIRKADLAMYAAKAAGKGCVQLFDESMDKEAKYLIEMQSALRQALEKQQFYLVYQPLVNAATEELNGFEALIRWKHPEKGLIPPAAFIDTAEKLGLMDRIGQFVLDRACEFASTWKPDCNGKLLRISVNVSPQQFRDEKFIEIVKSTLERYSLEPERLELEITENLLIHNLDQVVDILKELRAMKVSIAIDDFGSGQTSLRYLNQFPVSTLKIDRSFIKHLGHDVKADEITESIVGLGKKLGVTVLAEGVEDKAQLAQLNRWDCDQAQGYYFSKPISDENVLGMLDGESGDQNDGDPDVEQAA